MKKKIYSEMVSKNFQPKVSQSKRDELINELKSPKSIFGKVAGHADPSAFDPRLLNAGIKKSERNN